MIFSNFLLYFLRYSFGIPSVFLRFSFGIHSVFLRYSFGIPSVASCLFLQRIDPNQLCLDSICIKAWYLPSGSHLCSCVFMYIGRKDSHFCASPRSVLLARVIDFLGLLVSSLRTSLASSPNIWCRAAICPGQSRNQCLRLCCGWLHRGHVVSTSLCSS